MVSLGLSRLRFAVEVSYPRENPNLVLIHLEFWNSLYIHNWRHLIRSCIICNYVINLLLILWTGGEKSITVSFNGSFSHALDLFGFKDSRCDNWSHFFQDQVINFDNWYIFLGEKKKKSMPMHTTYFVLLKSIPIRKLHLILFYHPKKLLYQLYHTILQYIQLSKTLFFSHFI